MSNLLSEMPQPISYDWLIKLSKADDPVFIIPMHLREMFQESGNFSFSTETDRILMVEREFVENITPIKFSVENSPDLEYQPFSFSEIPVVKVTLS